MPQSDWGQGYRDGRAGTGVYSDSFIFFILADYVRTKPTLLGSPILFVLALIVLSAILLSSISQRTDILGDTMPKASERSGGGILAKAWHPPP